MNLIALSFAVFAITLVLTKAKVLAGKREFVKQRYEASKVGSLGPGWIHRWWHAIWSCPMCAGFWVAIPVCLIFPVYGLFIDVLATFGANWLLHCLESSLFFGGETLEKVSEEVEDLSVAFQDLSERKSAIDDEKVKELMASARNLSDKLGNDEILRLFENFLRNLDRNSKDGV